MTKIIEKEKERIRKVARLLHDGAKRVRILRSIDWSPPVKQDFFAKNAKELPEINYPSFDAKPTIDIIREARRMIIPISPIDQWLERQANSIETGARMLAGMGTPVFFEHSRQVYGEPTAPLRYIPVTSLELAQNIQDTIDQLARIDLGVAPTAHLSAEDVARDIQQAVSHHFGKDAPKVTLVDTLSANALATADEIRIRRDARFTDRDAVQLLNHEAYIHVATSLNGRIQTDLPILSAGHPSTTRTQEGLAVFAEIISGTMELDRLRRLADRVFAIQMAVEGADFLEVYNYFLERTGNADQSFENARRVFRGGVITGGAPFTKDVVYLFGLLQVSNTINAIFSAGRSDCLRLLFCGKLDIQDIPALCELAAMGLCRPARYLPPWASDLRSLLALLTYSTFMNKLNLEPMVAVVQKLLENAPIVEFPVEE
ncbi:MAG: flavohemoglobin expression-modulating QEGLA motif protein [Methylococcaceae bacterium]|nr:flavohemoglobin expression-modulating QEGLA motif protein [Methylococcaceae bacterium]